MGEIVSGVGDEVLFFATFLVLVVCMYVGIIVYRNRREHGQHNETNNSRDRTQRETNVGDPSPTQPIPHDTQSTLRSRFHTTTDPNLPSDSSTQEVEGQHVTVEETSDTSQTSLNDGLINVRLIKSDASQLIRVAVDTTLQELRNTYFREELAQNRAVKFIFQGRVLGDNGTLRTLGITDGRAVHVHIGRPHPPGEVPNAGPQDIEEVDLSRLFVPLFGLILGITWVSMLCYPSVFSFMTKLFLFVLSLGYVFLAYVTTFG